MSKLKFCVKHGWDQLFLSGLRDQNFGKMGLRDQNNGKKIGINGSRIYHVTTLNFSRHIDLSVRSMVMEWESNFATSLTLQINDQT